MNQVEEGTLEDVLPSLVPCQLPSLPPPTTTTSDSNVVIPITNLTKETEPSKRMANDSESKAVCRVGEQSEDRREGGGRLVRAEKKGDRGRLSLAPTHHQTVRAGCDDGMCVAVVNVVLIVVISTQRMR